MNGGTLGADESLGQAKKGFWPANLDVSANDIPEGDEDAASPGGDLRAEYAAMKREAERSAAEVAALKQQLVDQSELHRQNVKKMLKANEDLQQQLEELNGVVERVVQVSLGGKPPAAAAPEERRQKLPAAFAAKPGSKKGAAPKKK